ncbi:hypothetical protein BC937DRAFT_94201, partial [Endogone sp. FLAS-F59071]
LPKREPLGLGRPKLVNRHLQPNFIFTLLCSPPPFASLALTISPFHPSFLSEKVLKHIHPSIHPPTSHSLLTMLHNDLTLQEPLSPTYHLRHSTTYSSDPSLGSPPRSLPRRPPRGSMELLADPEDVDIGPFQKSSDDDEFQLMVLGKSGEGKSSLLNAILGEDVFRAKMSVSEVTKMVESHCGRWLGHPEYTAVKCVDTPSFAGQLADRTRVAQIRNFLEECMNGVDAFLVVIKVTHYRYDASIQATLKVYETILTPSFWQNAILVFSHADPETAPTWSDSQPYFKEFAKQIAKQFRLSQPPPICFASDKRSFGKCSTNIRNMGANGEIVVHEGARFFTIEPPAQTLYQHIKKLHSRPYFPTHLTSFLRTRPDVTPLEFVDKLMVTIERLEGFREIDKKAAQRQSIRDDPSMLRSSHAVGPYNHDNSSIATFGSAQSASSWSRPILPLPLINDDERPKRRAVSVQPSPTEPVDPVVGSFGGRIAISAMAGLLQLPVLRRTGSSGASPRSL